METDGRWRLMLLVQGQFLMYADARARDAGMHARTQAREEANGSQVAALFWASLLDDLDSAVLQLCCSLALPPSLPSVPSPKKSPSDGVRGGEGRGGGRRSSCESEDGGEGMWSGRQGAGSETGGGQRGGGVEVGKQAAWEEAERAEGGRERGVWSGEVAAMAVAAASAAVAAVADFDAEDDLDAAGGGGGKDARGRRKEEGGGGGGGGGGRMKDACGRGGVAAEDRGGQGGVTVAGGRTAMLKDSDARQLGWTGGKRAQEAGAGGGGGGSAGRQRDVGDGVGDGGIERRRGRRTGEECKERIVGAGWIEAEGAAEGDIGVEELLGLDAEMLALQRSLERAASWLT